MMRDLDLLTWLLATPLGGKKCFGSIPPSQGVPGSSCGPPTRPSGLGCLFFNWILPSSALKSQDPLLAQTLCDGGPGPSQPSFWTLLDFK